jgi:hypothetical protein
LVRNSAEAPVGVLDPAPAGGEAETPTLPLLDPPAFDVPVTLVELVEVADAPTLPEPALWLSAVL